MCLVLLDSFGVDNKLILINKSKRLRNKHLLIMNNLQRILLTSGLAATASLMANSAAFAGTTATVPLSGTVPSSLTITVTPITANTSALPLTPGTSYSATAGGTDIKIATITAASTNSPGGLKVTATGNGRLVSGTNFIGLSELSENIGSSATSSQQGRSFAAGSSFSFDLFKTVSSTAGSAPDSSIFIGYSVPANQAPGTYTGSITFQQFQIQNRNKRYIKPTIKLTRIWKHRSITKHKVD